MHSQGRGSSGSNPPEVQEPPVWSEKNREVIEARVVKLAREGYNPSDIGRILRDTGIKGTPVPDVQLATGKKITKILEEYDSEPEIPEDLRNLLERAVRLHEHVSEHPQDHQNKRALQNTEAKVRRLVDYYRGSKLDENFNYSYENAVGLLNDTKARDLTEDYSKTDYQEDSPELDQLYDEIVNRLDPISVTDSEGEMVKGPIETNSVSVTYEKFTDGSSVVSWTGDVEIDDFDEVLDKILEVTSNTEVEVVLVPSDNSIGPEYTHLEDARNRKDFYSRCKFLAAVTDKFDITWELLTEEPQRLCEIALLIKQDEAEIADALNKFLNIPHPDVENFQTEISLLKKLHSTEREKMIQQNA